LPILLNPDGTKMSKRKGDVQVLDYIKQGWEPAALLNWLALVGWGTHSPASPGSSPTSTSNSASSSSSGSFSTSRTDNAPDSTQIMTLPQIIDQFDLSSLTHRRNVLDLTKLEYLNKHHLMLAWSTREGLESLAMMIYPLVKEAFPKSQYTSIEDIMKVILTLERRLTTINDVPSMAPFFFVDPDLSSEEARSMIRPFSESDRKCTLEAVVRRIEQIGTGESWEVLPMADILHVENAQLGLKSKIFMTVLRHALTGMKNGPGVPEIMRTLGRQRTLTRLKTAHPATLIV